MAEEERLLELRSAIQCRSEELEDRQSRLERREKALLSADKSPIRSDSGGSSGTGDGMRRHGNISSQDKVFIINYPSFVASNLLRSMEILSGG